MPDSRRILETEFSDPATVSVEELEAALRSELHRLAELEERVGIIDVNRAIENVDKRKRHAGEIIQMSGSDRRDAVCAIIRSTRELETEIETCLKAILVI